MASSITIPLYYDLDLLLWTSAAGGLARQPNLVLGQSDSIDFAVQFVRSGVVVELTNPQWICGIKPINDTAGDYLVNTTTATKTGTTTSTVYTFTLLLDSIELRAWLLTVTAVTNYAAFSIRDTVNLIATLPAITCSILPDYTLVNTTPSGASGSFIVDSGQTFTVHKTFGMPTDDGQPNYFLRTNGFGIGAWAAVTSNNGTVTSVAASFTGGIVQVSGSPVTTSGGFVFSVSGTAGGIPYFSTATSWASSAAITAGALFMSVASGFGGQTVPTGLSITAGGLFMSVASGTGTAATGLSATTAGKVLVSMGLNTVPTYTSNPSLGSSAAGGVTGTLTLANSSSGSVVLTPPTIVAGGTIMTFPGSTTALAGLAITQTFTMANTFSSSVSSTSPTSGAVIITGGLGVGGAGFFGSKVEVGVSGTTTGTVCFENPSSGTITLTPPAGALGTSIVTLPNGTTTLAGLAMTQTFTSTNTFSSAVNLTLGTDATSSTVGGTLTVTGGVGISKKLFVGTLLDIVTSSLTAGQLTQNGTRLMHTYGTQNLFVGLEAGNFTLGATATGAASNLGFGREALKSVTTGSRNCCFGDVVSNLLTTGNDNTIFGTFAGQVLTTGSSNTAVGKSALGANETSNRNTAIGMNALTACVGASNVGIGFNAAVSLTGTAGTNAFNVCVGYGSGWQAQTIGGITSTALTTGTNNTILGANAGSTVATGTYRTAVGSDSICESNNAIKLGRDTLDVVILPKMTTAQLATAATTLGAVKGAIAYCTDGAHADHVHFYNGSSWAKIG